MTTMIGNKEVELRSDDVLIAKKAISSFLKSMQAGAYEAKRPSLYFTTLVLTYKKSLELLYALTPDTLQTIMSELTVVENDEEGTSDERITY